MPAYPLQSPDVNEAAAIMAAMRDPQQMAEDYLGLADGLEARALWAVDPRLGEELRKTAEHYRLLAAEVEGHGAGKIEPRA
jgi:hypothetical protein